MKDSVSSAARGAPEISIYDQHWESNSAHLHVAQWSTYYTTTASPSQDATIVKLNRRLSNIFSFEKIPYTFENLIIFSGWHASLANLTLCSINTFNWEISKLDLKLFFSRRCDIFSRCLNIMPRQSWLGLPDFTTVMMLISFSVFLLTCWSKEFISDDISSSYSIDDIAYWR